MKNYNPISLTMDMPCQFIPLDGDSRQVLTGHFAFFNGKGEAYVWKDGGTSYTRRASFRNSDGSHGKPEMSVDGYIESFGENKVTKCSHVFPLATHDEEWNDRMSAFNLIVK